MKKEAPKTKFEILKKEKKTNDELLSQIQIKSIEKENLDRVFRLLNELEQELSSDDDSMQKQYLKNIKEKANSKKMNFLTSSQSNQTKKINKNDISNDSPKTNKKYQEDKINTTADDEENTRNMKFGVKGLRKILRELIGKGHNNKEELEQMVWENDENLDNYIDYNEYEKMYKRCVYDLREQEPKKLFYLVQFLMYDKERKNKIIEEDTLEILYIRYGSKFENSITDIFAELDEKGQIKRDKAKLRKELNFQDYVERMHLLSQDKRSMLSHHKKDYCSYIPQILKDNKLPVIHEPTKNKNVFKGVFGK